MSSDIRGNQSQLNAPGRRHPATETYFAPPERASLSTLESQIDIACGHPITSTVLKTLGGIVMILNQKRQMVAANDTVFAALQITKPKELFGLRPGEAFRCIHVEDAPNGCGTNRACRACGAVLAILASQKQDQTVEEECFLTRRTDVYDEAVEFQVRAGPVRADETDFTVVTFQDIREKKLSYTLQRVFLHDIMNYLQGLQGYAELLTDEYAIPNPSFAEEILEISEYVLECIRSHRDLISMENNEYTPHREVTTVRDIFRTVRKIVVRMGAARGRRLDILSDHQDADLTIDATLLVRVVTNMVKNAMEATPIGEKICLAHKKTTAGHVFEVWNPGEIPQQVAGRIFQRYFSTKREQGRGLGTYCMKLIGQRYLGGEVSFSTGPDGTTFRFFLPHAE